MPRARPSRSKLSAGVRVRRSRATDWRGLRELRFRMLAEDPLAFRSSLEEEKALPESAWRARAARTARSEEVAQFVAEAPPGRLVGGAVVAKEEKGMGLFAMWVEPEHRGTGLGGRLLDSALGWASAHAPGVPIWLHVNARQAAAIRLYESRGFDRTGRAPALPHSPKEVVHEMTRPPLRGAVPVRRALEKQLQQLPGLTRHPSRYGDGRSYFVGDREIAHFHGDQRIDLRLTKERLREMRAEAPLDPRIRTRGRSAEWASVHVGSSADVPFVLHLVETAIRANA